MIGTWTPVVLQRLLFLVKNYIFVQDCRLLKTENLRNTTFAAAILYTSEICRS